MRETGVGVSETQEDLRSVRRVKLFHFKNVMFVSLIKVIHVHFKEFGKSRIV